jgi:hypothetical protein
MLVNSNCKTTLLIFYNDKPFGRSNIIFHVIAIINNPWSSLVTSCFDENGQERKMKEGSYEEEQFRSEKRTCVPLLSSFHVIRNGFHVTTKIEKNILIYHDSWGQSKKLVFHQV